MDENGTKVGVCDKLEGYLGELGQWSVWRAIILGQILSILLCTMAFLSHYIYTDIGIILPTAQNFFHYMLLFIFYTVWLALRKNKKGLISIIRSRGWRYLLLSLIDVQANTLLTASHQFTTLTSIQLLDCIAIPITLALSCLVLGVRYRMVHIVGISVCLMGIGCLVWSDIENGSPIGKNQLVGDMLCLGGAILFAVVIVLQELSVKTTDIIEYLGMVGLFGSTISGVQMFLLEKQTILSVRWENMTELYHFIRFGGIQFIFYSLTAIMLYETGATGFQLSLLTADYYCLIAGILLLKFKFHGLYFLSFTLIMIGIFIFFIKKIPISSQHRLHHNYLEEDTISMQSRPQSTVGGLSSPVSPDRTFEIAASLGAINPATIGPPDCLPLSMSTDTAFSSFYGSQTLKSNYNQT